eukprot:11995222-Heterocapsa_arctica.AAC.1
MFAMTVISRGPWIDRLPNAVMGLLVVLCVCALFRPVLSLLADYQVQLASKVNLHMEIVVYSVV